MLLGISPKRLVFVVVSVKCAFNYATTTFKKAPEFELFKPIERTVQTYRKNGSNLDFERLKVSND